MHQCTIAVLLLSLISFNSFSAAKSTSESVLAQDDDQETPEVSAHTIHHVLVKAKIIPSVIEDFNPLCYLDIIYPASHESVSLGNKIWPKDAQTAPAVQVSCPLGFGYHPHASVSGTELMLEDEILTSESTKTSTAGKDLGPFTIVLTDPDAPSRKNPMWGEMCHWIASLSFPDTSSTVSSSSAYFELSPDMKIDSPMELVPYKAPGPPPKTGYHRYVFLLFSGDNSNLTAPAERQHWGMGEPGRGVKDWAKREGLKVVGANFFYARDKKQ